MIADMTFVPASTVRALHGRVDDRRGAPDHSLYPKGAYPSEFLTGPTRPFRSAGPDDANLLVGHLNDRITHDGSDTVFLLCIE
jgi:hypothetical protein